MARKYSKEEVTRELRSSLFPEIFRVLEAKSRVSAADREMWREVYLEDPDEFDFATGHNWIDADAVAATLLRREHLARTLRHPRPSSRR